MVKLKIQTDTERQRGGKSKGENKDTLRDRLYCSKLGLKFLVQKYMKFSQIFFLLFIYVFFYILVKFSFSPISEQTFLSKSRVSLVSADHVILICSVPVHHYGGRGDERLV
jgi:hypothetical protein